MKLYYGATGLHTVVHSFTEKVRFSERRLIFRIGFAYSLIGIKLFAAAKVL